MRAVLKTFLIIFGVFFIVEILSVLAFGLMVYFSQPKDVKEDHRQKLMVAWDTFIPESARLRYYDFDDRRGTFFGYFIVPEKDLDKWMFPPNRYERQPVTLPPKESQTLFSLLQGLFPKARPDLLCQNCFSYLFDAFPWLENCDAGNRVLETIHKEGDHGRFDIAVEHSKDGTCVVYVCWTRVYLK